MKMNVLNTKYIEKRRKMIIKRVTVGFKIRLKANVNLTIENYIYKNPYISLFYVLCKRDSIVLINSIVTSYYHFPSFLDVFCIQYIHLHCGGTSS
jgi:hypothetical protein